MDKSQIVSLLKEQRVLCLKLQSLYTQLIDNDKSKDQYMNEGRLQFINSLLDKIQPNPRRTHDLGNPL